MDFRNVLYAVLGGVSMMIVSRLLAEVRNRMTGRDALVSHSTFIRRHACNRREIEGLMRDNATLRSIVMQGVDAAFIAFREKTPSVAILYLNKPRDARLFRACLDHLDDPETMYALATQAVAPGRSDGGVCAEVTDTLPERTWFRYSHGKDAIDEKVDDTMLQQVMTLAQSRDRDLSQSGACHISLKTENEDQSCDILVLPTSAPFRRAFKAEHATDDLALFSAKDLFEKIVGVRRKMSV